MSANGLYRAALTAGLGAALIAGGIARADPAVSPASWIRLAIDRVCPMDGLDGLSAQGALPSSWLLRETRAPSVGAPRRVRVTLALPGGDELHLERRQAGGALRQFVVAHYAAEGDGLRPTLQAFADGGCATQSGRRIRRDGPVAVLLDQLDGDLETVRWSETLQAPWPPGADPGGPRVAMVDSGLAYDLPLFHDHLARSADGTPIGYDFWDLDAWPYDGDVSRGPFLPIRHGTAVASVLVREAPSAGLAVYRYPRPDMSRLEDVVEHAAAARARILAMPLGSNRREDWDGFARALQAHDMLAIVSAGNDGRDIDSAPVWPAALELETLLVVTSADAFGRLAPGSNWGARSVDVMLPAENVPVVDFRGASARASGSSYAVPRLAALAARLLEAEPALSARALKRRVLERATRSPYEREPLVAVGWIPDPAAD
ncbi:MAG: S8 family serine peptidase [Pseudomonadota bacterium]